MGTEWLSALAVYLHDCMAAWELGSLPLPSIMERIIPPITKPGKEQTAQFEVWFLLNTD